MAIYLKYGDAQGDVTEANHTHWVELLDAHWSMSRTIRSAVGNGKNRESTSAHVSELTMTKLVDNSSHVLATYAFVGQARPAQIDFTRVSEGGEIVFRTLHMKDAIISSLNNSGAGKERPVEVLTLNFTELTIEDHGQDSSGNKTAPKRIIYDLTQAKTA
ncbi:Hcp family type VI secretion system effector [Swingsia samuiensis]|uniref:Type VI secretion system tube protein Hcp n=1 Tax=Swingsia samuiensis TaxID=1293412 RepID=A0A4Y6UFJ5_9PROT|nr:type VI secretion system tube protein Hcp [Swingsia samuiensis]QDH16323.1 type VI secretion system tube protein Hcp [Swingsia samuiensis]